MFYIQFHSVGSEGDVIGPFRDVRITLDEVEVTQPDVPVQITTVIAQPSLRGQWAVKEEYGGGVYDAVSLVNPPLNARNMDEADRSRILDAVKQAADVSEDAAVTVAEHVSIAEALRFGMGLLILGRRLTAIGETVYEKANKRRL